MELLLNGAPVSVEVEEGDTLLDLLRGQLGIRSVKDGCSPEGSCGACTVIVDGRAAVACAQQATRAEGKEVVTQEGLAEAVRRLWAECFDAAGASQCGYCSPGIVMKAEALLSRKPDPSRDEIAHALLGNLCRCTGYVKIVDAVLLAAAARRGEAFPEPERGGRVGTRAARYRGAEQALGDQQFVQPRRGEPLLAAGPLTRFGQQRFDAHPHGLPDGSRPRLCLSAFRNGVGEVFPDGPARNPQLFRDLPRGAALYQDFMTNDVYLVHPEHPFQRTRSQRFGQAAIRPPGGSLSERRMDHFPTGAPTFAQKIRYATAQQINKLRQSSRACQVIPPRCRGRPV